MEMRTEYRYQPNHGKPCEWHESRTMAAWDMASSDGEGHIEMRLVREHLSDGALPPTPRNPCPVCGKVLDAECPACVEAQVARELDSLPEQVED